ncbi:serine/threonine-protein kinase VRK3-like isoform 2-T2 [Trichechus inunguis]
MGTTGTQALPHHTLTSSRWTEGSGSRGRLDFTETLQEYLKVLMALRYDKKPPYTVLRNNLEAPLQDLQVSAYYPVDLHMVVQNFPELPRTLSLT